MLVGILSDTVANMDPGGKKKIPKFRDVAERNRDDSAGSRLLPILVPNTYRYPSIPHSLPHSSLISLPNYVVSSAITPESNPSASGDKEEAGG